jgi:hypothetical protein
MSEIAAHGKPPSLKIFDPPPARPTSEKGAEWRHKKTGAPAKEINWMYKSFSWNRAGISKPVFGSVITALKFSEPPFKDFVKRNFRRGVSPCRLP